MDLSEYQRAADETNRFKQGNPEGKVPSLLGLASETGSILDVYKKYLRDRIDVGENREFLREELGDLLWYVAVVAKAFDLDLEEVAARNLERTLDLYGPRPALDTLAVLDRAYPDQERFPRRLTVEFTEQRSGDRLTASLKLIEADPNAFEHGPLNIDGKPVGFSIGQQLGADLTDNSRRMDGYRFHDAIHMGFMAVLGWSPTMRALLRLKRKSDPKTDESEDGARAIYAEEGLSAVLSRLAERRSRFLSETSVVGETIEVVRAVVMDLEVESLPSWLWRMAITQGFQAMRKLRENSGGYLLANLDQCSLTYQKVR